MINPANIHQESHSGVIDLTKFEPSIVGKMLRFIYQHDYDDEREINDPGPRCAFGIRDNTGVRNDPPPDLIELPPQEPGRPFWNGEALIINTKVFVIAEKLNLRALMEHAAEKYEEAAGELWRTLSFVRSMELLYSSKLHEINRWSMRRVIVNVIVKNAAVLLRRETFRELLTLHGDMATQVLSITVNGDDWW